MTPATMALHATLIRSLRAIATAWERWLEVQQLEDKSTADEAESRVSIPTPDTRQRNEPANASPVNHYRRDK